MAVIADAVAGLEKANNPHVVKVRENLRKVVLQTFTETSMKNLVTSKMLTPDSLAEATKVKASVGKDLERIGTAINAPIVGPQPEPENE